jgi:hypothetical protein
LKLDKLLFSNITGGSQKFAQFVKQQAAKRTQLGLDTDRRDFFYYLLNAQDPDTGVGFSMPELWAESSKSDVLRSKPFYSRLFRK